MPLTKCNEAQLAAIKHFQGPMLLAAGPGSGKTFTIVERIRYLIEQNRVEPSHILVITFTKAAASEMQKRFQHAVNPKNYNVQFGTFHAVFYHILKQAYHYRVDNIISEQEKRNYLKEALEGIKEDADEAFFEQILGEFGKVKNSAGGIKNYHLTNDFLEPEQFCAVYNKYRELCLANRKMDFDDMALQCFELFKRRKDILHEWKERFRFVMVDEFQDVNAVQFAVLKQLAGPDGNLFVVGDDDQSIYGFRGANPVIMQKFLKEFRHVKYVLLDRNYRSGKAIVDTSMKIISENKNRINKKIIAWKAERGEVVLKTFESKQKQDDYLLEQIKQQKRENKLEECAVIFRTNRGMEQFNRQLQKAGIPHSSKMQKQNNAKQKLEKDMEDYFRFALGEQTRERFLRIMNKPSRYISRESLGTEAFSLECVKRYYMHKPEQREAVEQLECGLKLLPSFSPFLAINYLRKAMRYDLYLKELSQSRESCKEMETILDEIQEEAASFQSLEEWISFRETTPSGEKSQKEETGLHVMTMHGAKGLEFETVFLPDIVEGNVPYGKMLTKEQEEEERRVFYVAITRAKERLEMYSIENEMDKPSRFLPKKKN